VESNKFLSFNYTNMKTKLTYFIVLLFSIMLFSRCSEEDIEIDDHPVSKLEYEVYSRLFEELELGDFVLRAEPSFQSIGELNSRNAESYGIFRFYPQFEDLIDEEFAEYRRDSIVMENRFKSNKVRVNVLKKEEISAGFVDSEGNRTWDSFEALYGDDIYYAVSRMLFDEKKETAVFEIVKIYRAQVNTGVAQGAFCVMEKKGDTWELGYYVGVWIS
ncbi:MAG: hypothetical protein AAFQ94_29415, partial [Bacteroidota bacterium]